METLTAALTKFCASEKTKKDYVIFMRTIAKIANNMSTENLSKIVEKVIAR